MGFAALKTNLLQLKHCQFYLPAESTNKRDVEFEPKMRSLITANINDFFPHLYFKYRTGNPPGFCLCFINMSGIPRLTLWPFYYEN